MRAEAGHIIVHSGKVTTIMPRERFAEAHPGVKVA